MRSPRHRIAYMGHAIKACDRYLCRSISQLVFQRALVSRKCPGELLFSSLQRSRQQASMRHFDRIDRAPSVGTNHHNLSLFRGPHHRFPWPGAVLSFLPQYLQDGAALRRLARYIDQAMTTYPQKVTFGEMRASGVRDVVIYCRDHPATNRRWGILEP